METLLTSKDPSEPAAASTAPQMTCCPCSSWPHIVGSSQLASTCATSTAIVVVPMSTFKTNSYLPIGSNYRGPALSDLLSAYLLAARLYDSLAFS